MMISAGCVRVTGGCDTDNLFGEGWRETARGEDVRIDELVQLGEAPVSAAAFRVALGCRTRHWYWTDGGVSAAATALLGGWGLSPARPAHALGLCGAHS